MRRTTMPMMVIVMPVIILMRSVTVVIMPVTKPLLAMEYQEEHAETVKRRHKHTHQHQHIGIACRRQMGLVHRFDNQVLGKEAREPWETYQRQRADQEVQ